MGNLVAYNRANKRAGKKFLEKGSVVGGGS